MTILESVVNRHHNEQEARGFEDCPLCGGLMIRKADADEYRQMLADAALGQAVKEIALERAEMEDWRGYARSISSTWPAMSKLLATIIDALAAEAQPHECAKEEQHG